MRSHQLLGLSPKEELAKHQINPLEDDDGQILRSIPSLNPATRELVQLAWREHVVNTSVYRKQGELRPCIRLVNCETHPLFSDENENNTKSTLSHVSIPRSPARSRRVPSTVRVGAKESSSALQSTNGMAQHNDEGPDQTTNSSGSN